jgi:hypothetical protein
MGIVFAFAVVSLAVAQSGADVQISKLSCDGDPELVVIENSGDAAQSLTGWELRSDPEASEAFDLRDLGSTLSAGASITIQSGPTASGVFIWTADEVFRDDDPTDYVRLVDDTGTVVQQVDCAEPAPTPSPSPEPSPVTEVPNGGGSPPVVGGTAWPLITLLIGGSLAMAGVAMIALTRMRLRTVQVSVASSPPAEPRVANRRRREPLSPTISLALLGLVAVVMFLILWSREG